MKVNLEWQEVRFKDAYATGSQEALLFWTRAARAISRIYLVLPTFCLAVQPLFFLLYLARGSVAFTWRHPSHSPFPATLTTLSLGEPARHLLLPWANRRLWMWHQHRVRPSGPRDLCDSGLANHSTHLWLQGVVQGVHTWLSPTNPHLTEG